MTPTKNHVRPEGGPAFAFGYSRISKDKPAFKDARDTYSMEAQRDACLKYYHDELEREGVQWWGVFGDDHGVSAKVALLSRKAGSELNSILRKGDHVIMPKLDRAWRDSLDCLTTIKEWEERGIGIHFVAENLEISHRDPLRKALAKMLVTLWSAIAQMERDKISERIKEALDAKKRRLGYTRRNALRKGGKYHPHSVALAGLAIWLIEVRGLSTYDSAKVFAGIGLLNKFGRPMGVNARQINDLYKQGKANNVQPSGKLAEKHEAVIQKVIHFRDHVDPNNGLRRYHREKRPDMPHLRQDVQDPPRAEHPPLGDGAPPPTDPQ